MEINREFVDLGLPSGLLWAKCNIGANSPEDGGLYFQWGDTKGYTAEQVGTNEGQKEFSSSYTDDAAHVLMGGNWRLPTHEELHELVTNTDMFLVPTEGEEIAVTINTDRYPTGYTDFAFATTASTCTGMKFYKKDDHSVYLFVPAVGAAGAGSVMLGASTGGLWSSSVYSSDVKRAWDLVFYSVGGYGVADGGYRYYGVPLRGVCSK